jgi:hypothetical protein
MRELWAAMWISTARLMRMSPLERQVALAQQFAAWMAVGFIVFVPVPAGLVFLALAAWKAAAR